VADLRSITDSFKLKKSKGENFCKYAENHLPCLELIDRLHATTLCVLRQTLYPHRVLEFEQSRDDVNFIVFGQKFHEKRSVSGRPLFWPILGAVLHKKYDR